MHYHWLMTLPFIQVAGTKRVLLVIDIFIKVIMLKEGVANKY